MANKPIDPLRMRLFSELNIQLAPHCIDKDTMNETSKHLAFLTRCYLNTPDPNPLAASIPIVSMRVRSHAGTSIVLQKIALVVHLDSTGVVRSGCPSPSTTGTTTATGTGIATSETEASVPATNHQAEQDAVKTSTSTTTTTTTMTSTMTSTTPPVILPSRKPQGPRPTCQFGSAAPAAAGLAAPTRPRVRVLIQMVGSVGHWKCLMSGFASKAERVVAGLVNQDERVMRACEEGRVQRQKCRGGKRVCGKAPVWDLEDEDC